MAKYILVEVEDQNPSRGCAYIAGILFLLAVGAVINWILDARRATAKRGFLKDDFSVIVVYEGEKEAEKKLFAAATGKFVEGKPKARLTQLRDDAVLNPDNTREFYAVKDVHVPGLPTPPYVERLSPLMKGGEPIYRPVYAVFGRPDAFDKFMSWAKEHGYSGTDYQLDWEFDKEYHTKLCELTKPGSKLEFRCYFKAGGHHYMWSGGWVTELSARWGSGNLADKKAEEQHLEYVRWLEQIAQN